jgi:hypothetical protein
MRINNPLSLTLGLPLCLFLACSNSSVKTENEPAPEADTTAAAPQEVTIASSDGVCAFIATGGWQQASGLHKKAQLQASNTYGDMYLVVFSEKKDRYGDLSLEDHSKTTRDHLLKTLTSPTISPPSHLTIDGNPAVQYLIRGYAKNMKIAYLHTDLESPSYFHEIIAWTPDSRLGKNRYALNLAINSFKETGAKVTAEKKGKK